MSLPMSSNSGSPRPSVLVVQHVAVEGLGLFAELLSEHRIETRLLSPGMALPRDALREADGVIVLGGPMGVHEADRHPRLAAEIDLLARAVAAKKPVLGICLGSQLLATALGAKVHSGERKELGWYDVTLAPAAAKDPLFRMAPGRFKALHWHGDVFDLPSGAIHLASSALTRHQAFAYGGSAWGLLFHLEAGLSEVEAMVRAFPEELAETGVNGTELIASTQAIEERTSALARAVFGQWIQLLDH